MLNFIPLFVILSLWTTYTLSIEPQKAVGDEDFHERIIPDVLSAWCMVRALQYSSLDVYLPV